MSGESRSGRARLWAWTGGGVLAAGIIAIGVSIALNQGSPATIPGADPTASPTSDPSTSPLATAGPTDPSGDVVDASVSERGWVPEPITTDPDLYIRAALSAASTFDTQRSTRDAWLTHLDTWFTPDTRYETETDRQEVMVSSKLELRQAVVLPQPEWDSLALESGRVAAVADGDISYIEVPEDASGDMRIGSADVVLTFTRADGTGAEHSFDETVRVSVQVLCGQGSIPTPDSTQDAGDCKVVRFFSEPMEP